MRGAVITGVGVALPEKLVTNADLALRIDTTDEWITDRTGIRERRIGGTTASLSVEACKMAMEKAGVGPGDIDLLILATTTPDKILPATAPWVQYELGLDCGAFDLAAACSGWVYGLVAAHGFIGCGSNRILVVGAETLSRIVDWDDRSTAILFSDGAGAAVVEAVDGPGQMLAWDLGADGSATGILYAEHGDFIKMDGREVFRRAVRVMVDSANRTLAKAGLTADDIDIVIPHQANIRIIEAANQRLGIPMEKTVIVLHRTGNNSGATVPTALHEAVETDRIHDGDLVLFVGFGAGMTWASALVRWGGVPKPMHSQP